MGAALDDVKVGRQFDTWLRGELENIVPCAWDGCGAGATWRFRMPCCGKGHNLCEPHKVIWMAVAEAWHRSPDHEPYCDHCGTRPIDPSKVIWTEL